MARNGGESRALVVLDSSQSKRLIARAVAHLPEVQAALKGGRLIVGNGTGNAFVVEELLGRPVSKWRYAAGVIAEGRLAVTDGATRLPPVALRNGEPYPGGWQELLQEFESRDVFIKGGNALDAEGNVGVLLASPVGGTVGQMVGVVSARGCHLIVPIGLEKMVGDVLEAARHCGIGATDWTDGIPCGMAVLRNARVVTELEAFEVLTGVAAWHVASGGICGSEGSVTIALEGPAAAVQRAFRLAESLAGEPPVTRE
jgi:hypothetical protein